MVKFIFASIFSLCFACGDTEPNHQIYSVEATPTFLPSSCGEAVQFFSHIVFRDDKVYINSLAFEKVGGMYKYVHSDNVWMLFITSKKSKITGFLSEGVGHQNDGRFKCFNDWNIKGEIL